MKELLLKYAQYNAWANNLLVGAILNLENGQIDEEIISSFPSIRKTVCHMWSAENIWWQRLTLAEHPEWVEAGFEGTFAEACTNWLTCSTILVAFVEKQYDDRALAHVFQFYDRKKVSHKQPVYLVLHHVFNHSTSHRGQLITMLRQLGVNKIPQTDFIAYVSGK